MGTNLLAQGVKFDEERRQTSKPNGSEFIKLEGLTAPKEPLQEIFDEAQKRGKYESDS